MGSATPTETTVERLLSFLIDVRRSFVVAANTGYNLLVVGSLDDSQSSVKVVNTHKLPDILISDRDGIHNSKNALFTAIDGIAYNLLSLQGVTKRLKELAKDAGIDTLTHN